MDFVFEVLNDSVESRTVEVSYDHGVIVLQSEDLYKIKTMASLLLSGDVKNNQKFGVSLCTPPVANENIQLPLAPVRVI